MLVKVECCGEQHRVILSRKGKIALLDHEDVDIEAEITAHQLGGEMPACIGILWDFQNMKRATCPEPLSDPLEEASQRRWLRFMQHIPEEVEWAGGNYLARVLGESCKACAYHVVHAQPIDVRWSWSWTARKIGNNGVIQTGGHSLLVADADYRDGGWLLVFVRDTADLYRVVWMRAGAHGVPQGMTLAYYMWEPGTWEGREEGKQVYYKSRTYDAFVGSKYTRLFGKSAGQVQRITNLRAFGRGHSEQR